ncbi:hypothetical protein H2203_008220 [Taxawa tesnikishii (nom. ined.)]|nr:hypothetical protein H2203_008220 [Dothideales sp. JES 119]
MPNVMLELECALLLDDCLPTSSTSPTEASHDSVLIKSRSKKMPKAVGGTLVQCDPSIKAIILKIDAERGNQFVIEDLDDEHLLIRPKTEEQLKALLKDALKDTVREAEDSSSE